MTCVANYYLSNNECLQVPEDNLVPNCLYYADENVCLVCDILQNTFINADTNTCDTITARNCASYSSPT